MDAKSSRAKQITSDISLLLVTVIWGSSFFISKGALYKSGPITFLAVRFSIALLVMLPFFITRIKRFRKKDIPGNLLISISFFLAFIFQIVGLKYTTSPRSAFITAMSVVLVPILSVFIIKSVPELNSIIGVVFAVLGLSFLFWNGGKGTLFGDLMTLVCAIAFAIHIILIGRYASEIDPVIINTIQIAFAAIGCWMLSAIFENLTASFSASSLIAAIYTAIFGTSLAFGVQAISGRYTPPVRMAIIFSMEPVFAMIFSFIFTKERLTAINIIGCALIFLGMILSEIRLNIKKRRST
jgi:drug/metabolite transporter (DMT)-like permease